MLNAHAHRFVGFFLDLKVFFSSILGLSSLAESLKMLSALLFLFWNLFLLTFSHRMSSFPIHNLQLNWAVFLYEYACSWIVCELSQDDSKIVIEVAEKTLRSFTN